MHMKVSANILYKNGDFLLCTLYLGSFPYWLMSRLAFRKRDDSLVSLINIGSHAFPKIFTATFGHASGWFYRSNFSCCMCSAWRFIRCFSMFSSSLKWRFYFILFLRTVPVFALGTFPSWEDCSYFEWSFSHQKEQTVVKNRNKVFIKS